MGPIRNPNWSTNGMRVTLSYLAFGMMVLLAFSGISSPDPSVGGITAVADGLELVDGTGFSVATAG